MDIAGWLKDADAANAKLAAILTELATPAPPVEPPPVDPLITFVDNPVWSADSIDPVTGAWSATDRANQGTFRSNLSFADGKVQFNKKATQLPGYSSAIMSRRSLPGVRLSRLHIDLQVCYPKPEWKIYPNGSKHLFWSGQNGANHFVSSVVFEGQLRPGIGLQSPFYTLYCDYIIQHGVPYQASFVMDFKERWMEVWVNGERRKVNSASWIKPDVYRRENVQFFTDPAIVSCPLDRIFFEPTELQSTPPSDMMHWYGPLRVKGIPA